MITGRPKLNGVVAVIISFAPQPQRFAQVLAAAVSQCDAAIVVDNGLGVGLRSVEWDANVSRLDMNGNAGVAAAQNAGLRKAFAQGATNVLLLDHDSIADPGMVDALLDAYRDLEAQGERVATVGANYKDPRRPNVSPFVRIEGLRLLRLSELDEATFLPVSYVISSGSLIAAEAFAAVGPMDERLFIDYVDIEWGLRAAALGWRSYGVLEATLNHALGDEPLNIWGHAYPMRSPNRHYYMVRNASWLITRSSLPANWKFIEGWRLLRRSLAYAIFAPQARSHTISMLAGLFDAVRGRLGERKAPRLSRT